MIDLYYWPTPNGYKLTIMLEECGLPYRVCPVNIFKGDQFEPDFLKISPNNRMPAIVDDDCEGGPISIFESGAILVYLAEKTGRFMPGDVHGRYEVQQWVHWQMANLGPISGQCGHFRNYAPERVPYAIDRFTREVNRLYGVMNQRLADREFLAGDYSIADMASWPWVRPWKRYDQILGDFPRLEDWFRRMEARPAVQKAVKIGAELITQQPSSEEARRILFGQTAGSIEEQRRAHQR